MGCYTHLNVKECEGVTFDSVEQLNTDLIADGGVGELLDGYEQKNFVAFKDGKIRFYDREGESYYKRGVNVWGCVYKPQFKIIAKHMTAGKLVLELQTEGNGEETFVLTPGQCNKAKISYE